MLSTLHAADARIAVDADFRQLRHHTKNALQRILCQIERCRELQATADGKRLINDIERRVRLSSAVSDAMFGLTSKPGPLGARLQQLCDALIELLGDSDQLLRARVIVDPAVPAGLDDTVLRIVHEFVGNAIKHGLYARSVGNITVQVERAADLRVQIQVVDDGWGVCCASEQGEGLKLARVLAEQQGGSVGLGSHRGLTRAEASLHLR
jgi:two-component sensor histidine kinase